MAVLKARQYTSSPFCGGSGEGTGGGDVGRAVVVTSTNKLVKKKMTKKE